MINSIGRQGQGLSETYGYLESKIFDLLKSEKDSSKNLGNRLEEFAYVYLLTIELSPELLNHELKRLLILTELYEGYTQANAKKHSGIYF